ncbi:hypothetical protein A9995_03175 [Erythrobacter sp. QSSC1-22B]|uniref:DUF7010 family protein n=1 Tax=Erythrobacter sp. QSSC1-22B TaxID=1860125 RepID=UPI000805B788|nr:hypothetical protein [Erythrobacter sp. QSSC1-22B]OBX20708.1 hypothetical protein A9995_03175 [Erythrobacter sp. QSSC1-22B]
MSGIAAQHEMRRAYAGGGPGIIVSGIVWGIAAYFVSRWDVRTGFIALFIGGMTIFPLAQLVCRKLLMRPAPSPHNAVGMLGLESTIAMIALLAAAWLMLPFRPDAVFPFAAIAVGTHYFAFATLYGDRTFWLLAAILTAIGTVALFEPAFETLAVIIAVAVVELLTGLYLTLRERGAGPIR